MIYLLYPKNFDAGDEEKQIKDWYKLVIEHCHPLKITEVIRERERELEELHRERELEEVYRKLKEIV